jgi:hypothetical protein
MTEVPGGIWICDQCRDKHLEAVEALASGSFNGECSECGKTAEQLGKENLRMAVHYENGVYRLVCLGCDTAYTLKRKDLYGGTQFGRSLGME